MKGEVSTSSDVTGRLIARDESALVGLVDLYDRDMIRLCFLVCGDRDMARDATQNAWRKVWEHPPRLRDPGRLRTWLLTVAANEARQLARRSRTGRLRELAAPTPPASQDPTQGISRIDLSAALSRLDTSERELLALRYVSEFSSIEISKYLGISPEGVRSRLHRLVSRLREELRDE